MKLLITGSNGQLGSELKKILGSGISELGEIPVIYKGALNDCIDVVELDITNLSAVREYVGNSKPDVIINCAAYTNVDGCETNQDDAFKVNAIGARNLAMAAEAAGAKMVHISTDYVFAGDGSKPYCESDICNPKSVYGATKYLGEQYVRDFCSRYFIVRTAWLYGYVGKNFVKTIMKAGRERRVLKVVNDQIGNPTNAADLAYHILKIAATDEYGIYHCTGNRECSWYEFTCKIIEYSGIDAIVTSCTTEEYPSKTKRPAYSALDNMMLRCTVGDEMRNWQDAIKYFLEHYNEV
jgi:dTDP-4-dehydrorhamnose reductase